MIENKVILFNKKSAIQPKRQEKANKPSISTNQKVDSKITNRSAQNFLDSILSGNLYRELKPKDPNSKKKNLSPFL